ncbi:hypothetical protein [Psychrobacter cibarius]|uniref:hypothetical protein n=1 Tax=Psychrobacter cibarius TaxID=282669 RepID=UPI0018DF5F93|nr:hypothetical protein [Psychrobacter cibarius]
MSVSNNRTPVSIFDSQDSNELKERQRLEELKRQAKVQQVKLDKRLNKQKILMGAFLGQVLATDGESEQMIREYFAIHFPDFLTRKSDKELFKSMIESLGGDMGLGEEKDPSAVNIKESDRESENKQQTQSYGNAEHDIRDLLSDDNTYSTDVSDPNYRG